MTRRISLEDFDSAPKAQPEPKVPPPPTEPEIDIEGIRAAAFEDGYKSGWDDCHAENVKSEQAVSSDLLQSLKDMELTFQEARGDVLAAIRPVIDAIIEQLLPKLATDGLSAMVAKELMPLLEDAADLQAELLGSPQVVPILRKLVDLRDDTSVRIRPEPSFSAAQVSLRLGSEARDVDLTTAVEQISSELDQFTARLIAEIPEKR
ncbi:MAG: hypothetical protein AAGA70_02145 [Pseudomonadota bacterium]